MLIYRVIWFWKDAPLYLVVWGKLQGAKSTGTLLRFLGRYSAAQNDVTRGQRLSSGYSLDSINRGVFSLFVADYWGLLPGNTYAVHAGTCRSRGPCDMLAVKAYSVCVIALADYWGLLPGNTYAVYPGTRRSRGPCDMLAVKA